MIEAKVTSGRTVRVVLGGVSFVLSTGSDEFDLAALSEHLVKCFDAADPMWACPTREEA